MTPWTVVHQAPRPWNSPGKNIGVDCHSLLQGLFLTQGSIPGLQHCRQIGSDLVDRVPEAGWTEVHNIVQEAVTKTISQKKKCKKAKWLSREVLQIAEERRKVKGKGERERYTHLNGEFHRVTRRDKKAFLNEQCKEIGETI